MRKDDFDFYDMTMLKSYNLNESMQIQLNALGQLDVFTRKHCENVASIVCRLCDYLHCSSGFTQYCTMCAYLHDIGKVFVPASILQKPSKLTEEEYAIMKTHTTIGYEMCMKDPYLRPYAAGTIFHHEALNGTGYPKGLTKKDIPYEGQIIRVADEYDAIVSKRQYKSHVGITDTVKILIENTKPGDVKRQTGALSGILKNVKDGKDNPAIVKKLIKVVLEDIDYEIYNVTEYISYLEDELNRLKTAEKYYNKMIEAKSESKKKYFEEYMKAYLENNESVELFPSIIEEYIKTFDGKREKINELQNEKKKIKKLRV